MNYYEVIPAHKSFHGKTELTYCYEKPIKPGQVVLISLRNIECLAITTGKVSKPEFETTKILAVKNFSLPQTHLKLLKWMINFYPGALGATAALFAPNLLAKIDEPLTATDKLTRNYSNKLPSLTKEQSEAYRQINANKQLTHIVHGVTGSGKTRLYIELTKDYLSQSKSVIVLTPELSLTAPLAREFSKVFKDRVLINHHNLTPKKKVDLWTKIIYSSEPYILIGPRSSLFLPLQNIGLIVVDEFHESAYKQESQPYYHANRLASMLSQLSSAKLIFGSATPPINDYFLATQKKTPIINLTKPAITSTTIGKDPRIVDLTNPDEKSRYPLISNTLIAELTKTLHKSEQAMLFINKRGTARSIVCQDCGYRELCKNCDLPLVYHADQHLLRCHTCGLQQVPPSSCPLCKSLNIHFSSPGTKAIADSLAKLFPHAKIARFDRDNKKSERMENKYEDVVENIDIIIGTQTIAKGHDLPSLSLVAMLMADSSLNFPDYSSEERSYQLIKQLAGRINRGHRTGLFLVQTFDPKNRAVNFGLRKSWKDFYNNELDQRRRYGFPPFYSALKIEASRSSRSSAEKSLQKLATELLSKFKTLEIIGPSPSFVERKSTKWHWQIIIKSKNRADLSQIVANLSSSFKADIDPNNFL